MLGTAVHMVTSLADWQPVCRLHCIAWSKTNASMSEHTNQRSSKMTAGQMCVPLIKDEEEEEEEGGEQEDKE